MPDDVTHLPAPPDSDIEVRPARAEELTAAGEVVAAAYLNDLRVSSWYADRLRDTAARAAHATLLVAVDTRDRDTVLGSLTYARGGTRYAQVAGGDECEIRMLGVRPDSRGRGVGELLVRAAMAQGTADGAVRMVLSTQTEMAAAHRLYERLGFTRRPDLDWVPEQDRSVQLIGYERVLT
jgi:ribosomal protein S18 acetylase RimI-like enzyme